MIGLDLIALWIGRGFLVLGGTWLAAEAAYQLGAVIFRRMQVTEAFIAFLVSRRKGWVRTKPEGPRP